jgi:hypothetical protein
VHEPDRLAEDRSQLRVAVLGRGEVDGFRFRDERADPIDPIARLDRPADGVRDLLQALDTSMSPK